ncbi:MAG: Ldh family oxidoreductase [Anaerolineales bacterium]|nr:Ldh family oxidoreductase [Anaerolineales bacterium]
MGMIVRPAAELRALATGILLGLGAPEAVAGRVATALVESNLVGHDSHGVMRVPMYTAAIRAGTLDPAGALTVVAETPATLFLDCGWNLGHYACAEAMRRVMEKAAAMGIGLAVLRHCDHTGRIGEYVSMAAEQGCIGQVTCNGSLPGGLVAPYGGRGRALGANPLAWGLPGGPGQPPVFLDFATAAAAHGKLEVAAAKGERVPEGWIVDRDGRPTTDPREALEGGAILPFGGHKGYALGVMIELVGGALSGAGFPLLPDYRWDQGTVLTAINIEAFQPLAEFREQVGAFCGRLKAQPRAAGVEEIFIPGELEWRTRAQRERDGIALPEVTWAALLDEARAVGLAA